MQDVRQALEEVLASETFARSEQLRSFLRYVCERTLAGNGRDINEYSVATEALGKPADFSPGEDSSVRSRAYELRQKLQKYYESERQDAAIRIELPKGSYTPRFVEAQAPKPAPAAQPVRAVRILGAALAVFVLISIGLAVALLSQPPLIDPVVREAWGPLAKSEVLVPLATPVHMVVRPYMTVVAQGFPKYTAPPELYDFYRQHRPLPAGVELSMHPVDNSVQVGHAQSLAIVATTLRLMGASAQVLPERSASFPALRGRNVVVIGDPQNSNLVTEALEKAPLTLEFDAEAQDVVIRERTARHMIWAGKRGADRRYSEVYGLVTVLPGEGESSGPHRTIIFSGITSVGTHGATEYFTRPEALAALRDRLGGFPTAYQVVVRCRSNDTLLLSSEYAAHRVMAK